MSASHEYNTPALQLLWDLCGDGAKYQNNDLKYKLLEANLSPDDKNSMLRQLGDDCNLWAYTFDQPAFVFKWLSENGGSNAHNIDMMCRILEWFDEKAPEWFEYVVTHGFDLDDLTKEETERLRNRVTYQWPIKDDEEENDDPEYLKMMDRIQYALVKAERKYNINPADKYHKNFFVRLVWRYVVAQQLKSGDELKKELVYILAGMALDEIPEFIRLLSTPKPKHLQDLLAPK